MPSSQEASQKKPVNKGSTSKSQAMAETVELGADTCPIVVEAVLVEIAAKPPDAVLVLTGIAELVSVAVVAVVGLENIEKVRVVLTAGSKVELLLLATAIEVVVSVDVSAARLVLVSVSVVGATIASAEVMESAKPGCEMSTLRLGDSPALQVHSGSPSSRPFDCPSPSESAAQSSAVHW
jgi:hypothetical protein